MSRTKAHSRIKTIVWNSAGYPKTYDYIAQYLEAVFEMATRSWWLQL